MSRALADLCPRLLPLAEQLLAEAQKAGIECAVIDTLRTDAEHQRNLAAGFSWIKRSKHLPQTDCCGKAHAIDLCPAELLPVKGWAPASPYWIRLGEIAEKLGLVWGGRWKKRDLGHFELPRV